MDDNWLTDWLTDLLIDYKIVITKSVIIPAVSGLYRPTGLLFYILAINTCPTNGEMVLLTD